MTTGQTEDINILEKDGNGFGTQALESPKRMRESQLEGELELSHSL